MSKKETEPLFIGEDGVLRKKGKTDIERYHEVVPIAPPERETTPDVLDWWEEWEQDLMPQNERFLLCPMCRSEYFAGDATPNGKLLCWVCQFEAPLEEFNAI